MGPLTTFAHRQSGWLPRAHKARVAVLSLSQMASTAFRSPMSKPKINEYCPYSIDSLSGGTLTLKGGGEGKASGVNQSERIIKSQGLLLTYGTRTSGMDRAK